MKDTPISDSIWLFTDGSSLKDSYGKTHSVYAITTLTKVLMRQSLPASDSAQSAELKAVIAALHYCADFPVTIFTDSKYVYTSCHYHCAQLHLGNFKTSSGSEVKHVVLIETLTKALKLSSALAIIPAHTQKNDIFSRGNALADSAAQPATPIFTALITVDSDYILHDH